MAFLVARIVWWREEFEIDVIIIVTHWNKDISTIEKGTIKILTIFIMIFQFFFLIFTILLFRFFLNLLQFWMFIPFLVFSSPTFGERESLTKP